jgi:hypothetical protein
MMTATNDLFGLPPSTDGAALRAFRLPTRFTTLQTAQPITALRLLITLMSGAYPRCRFSNLTHAQGPEFAERLRNCDESQVPEGRPSHALEAGEIGAAVTAAQMRVEASPLSPGQQPVQVPRDGRLLVEAVSRTPHLPVRCAIAAFLAPAGRYLSGGGGGRVTVGTVTVTVRIGVETVAGGSATVDTTEVTGATTAPTVLAAVAAGRGDCPPCGSDAADPDALGAPPAEIESPVGAFRTVRRPATAERE